MELSGREWEIFLAGYEAGVTSGVTIGYREAIVDTWGAADLIRSSGILRHPTYAELQRRRTTYKTPPMSVEEMMERAYRSWGLTQKDRS